MARTGRPRGFHRDKAVEQAMHLFWEQGYEVTSLAQLKAAMGDRGGISAASFYATFGSKEALFREVFERYLATHGQVLAPLRDATLPPREAVERALRLSAKMQTDSAHPRGCLLVLSTSTCSPENRHIQTRLAQEREANRVALRGCVERAIAVGDLRAGSDVDALATVLNTFLVGLSTQTRDGVPRAALDAAITQLMGTWDVLTQSRVLSGEEVGTPRPAED